ncbi:MAG: hypothetical protein ACI8VW_003536 [bacterium]|jgi:hypothetical protein
MPQVNISIKNHCIKIHCLHWLLVCVFTLPIFNIAHAANSTSTLSNFVIKTYGSPPPLVEGELSENIEKALDTVFGENLLTHKWGLEQTKAIETLGDSNDPRIAWLISDMMRIAGSKQMLSLLGRSISALLAIEFKNGDYWDRTTNHLIAWDIPAPPNYLKYKRNIYLVIEPEWVGLFSEGDIDWRHVSWGGVRIDNRKYDETDARCNCIPAADNPSVTSAADAQWLKDDDIIFGIEVNGEYRAYPRRIMEVREMINDTLGGRDLGIPYCTLCGSAQAYYTDELPNGVQRPVLRTSGLLIRSNKVMYDVNTFSVFDTFRGHAVTGPLAAIQVKLKQASVVTAEWGRWKTAYPKTTVLAESLALGRDFDFRNNRDANGPIFPVGDVDPRLPVQEDVVGLLTASGIPIAFPVSQVLEALEQSELVRYENIQLTLDAGGVKAINEQGQDLGSHQSFWFAWSQFHPETKLWPL